MTLSYWNSQPVCSQTKESIQQAFTKNWTSAKSTRKLDILRKDFAVKTCTAIEAHVVNVTLYHIDKRRYKNHICGTPARQDNLHILESGSAVVALFLLVQLKPYTEYTPRSCLHPSAQHVHETAIHIYSPSTSPYFSTTIVPSRKDITTKTQDVTKSEFDVHPLHPTTSPLKHCSALRLQPGISYVKIPIDDQELATT